MEDQGRKACAPQAVWSPCPHQGLPSCSRREVSLLCSQEQCQARSHLSVVLCGLRECLYCLGVLVNVFTVRSCVESEMESLSVVFDSLRPHRLYRPWNSPGQNTGGGSYFLLQGIFPTQGWSPGLPHCRWILYQLSHKGSPGILEWVAYSFSRGSS